MNTLNSKFKLTRKELYLNVWKTPISKLAKQHEIVEQNIRDICKKLEIPLPSSGYWSKLRFNKSVEIPPLLKIKNDSKETNIEVINGKWIFNEHFQTKLYRLKNEIENDSNLNLNVPIKLTKPDPLTISGKKDLKDKKPSLSWWNPKGIIITEPGIIRIEVAKENIPRALRFMDTLVKLIKQRGHKIEFNSSTYVNIKEQRIKIRFREILKRVKVKDENSSYERTEKIPSGILSLQIEASYEKKEWRDTKKKSLDTKLSLILATLELRADELEKEKIEREKWRLKYEEERKKEQAIQFKFDEELAKFKKLKENAKMYQETQEIRNYIEAVKDNAIKNNTLTDELINWIEWANNKADWLDPIILMEDDLFSNHSI